MNDWTGGSKRKSNNLKKHALVLRRPVGLGIPGPRSVLVGVCDASHSSLRLSFSK